MVREAMGRMEVTEEVSPEIVICFHFFSGGSDVVSSIKQLGTDHLIK